MNFWKTALGVAVGIILAAIAISGSIALWNTSVAVAKAQAESQAYSKLSDLTPAELRQLCGPPKKEEKTFSGIDLTYAGFSDSVRFMFIRDGEGKEWFTPRAIDALLQKPLTSVEVLRNMPCLEKRKAKGR